MRGSTALPTLNRRLAQLLAVAAACASLLGCDEALPRVDMTPSAGAASSSRPDPDAPALLRIAIASFFLPETTRTVCADLLRLIAAELDAGVVLLQRRTGAELLDLLERQEVDLALVEAGQYVAGHDQFGLELLVVPVALGERPARAYLVVPEPSKATSLADLRGTRFALIDPLSHAGYALPRFMVAQRGETLERFFSETFFTWAHEGALRAVADGQADGAAVQSIAYHVLLREAPSLATSVRVVGESEPLGTPPLVVHPELPAEQKERLRETLLALHTLPDAKGLLERLFVERFDLGDDADYDSIRTTRAALEPVPEQ